MAVSDIHQIIRGRPRMAALALAASLGLTACSTDLGREYQDHDQRMQQIGYHRTERDPQDATFTEKDLAQNFVRIALAVEAMREQEASAVPLRRWEKPIRYQVYGGGATIADRRAISRYMDRIARITGLDISESRRQVNMPIFIFDRNEQIKQSRLTADADEPGVRYISRFLSRNSKRFPCRGSISSDDAGQILFAAVLIKAETSGRLRQACIEEELAQSMGLTNDHPDVRPSIFNDDQEFAYLTRHDEFLLAILYDRDLRPGWTAAEVRPRLDRIIERIRNRADFAQSGLNGS